MEEHGKLFKVTVRTVNVALLCFAAVGMNTAFRYFKNEFKTNHHS